MLASWEQFAEELTRWRDAGRAVEFWWRDDDAGGQSEALTRLIGLSSRRSVPLALAAIPAFAAGTALAALPATLAVIQHGSDHRNRAAKGQKKTEFPPNEPIESAVQRLIAGREMLNAAAGSRAIPVLAPPWNRIAPGLVPHLANAGFRGLSRFGVRNVTFPARGPVEVNTHVDIIDWRGSRGFCGIEPALGQAVRHLAARRVGEADGAEPTGWLSHHAVHDEACWSFLEQLFDATRKSAGVTWLAPTRVFGIESGA